MAIKPDISLQAQAPQLDPFAGVERGMKLQQLAMQPAILEQQLATAKQAEQTSRAAQMTSEAQLPGVRAASTKTVREAEQYPAFVQKEIGAFIDPITHKLDTDRWVEHTAKNGFGQEGLKYAGEQLGVYKQQIDNAKTEQERQVAANNARNSAITTIGNIVEATPEENRLKVINSLSAPLDNIMPGMGADVRSLFVNEDKDKGITTVNNNIVKAARTAGMTPEQQDANLRAFAQLDPEFKARLENVAPAQARIELALDAQRNEGTVNENNAGIAAIPAFQKQHSLPTKPGAILLDRWNKVIEQSPEAAKLQRSIDQYNLRNKANLSITDGLDAVRATLEQENTVLSPKIKDQRRIAEGGTIVPITQQQKIGEVSTGKAPPPRTMPEVKTLEEARALPPGTRFKDPNGVIRTR